MFMSQTFYLFLIHQGIWLSQPKEAVIYWIHKGHNRSIVYLKRSKIVKPSRGKTDHPIQIKNCLLATEIFYLDIIKYAAYKRDHTHPLVHRTISNLFPGSELLL